MTYRRRLIDTLTRYTADSVLEIANGTRFAGNVLMIRKAEPGRLARVLGSGCLWGVLAGVALFLAALLLGGCGEQVDPTRGAAKVEPADNHDGGHDGPVDLYIRPKWPPWCGRFIGDPCCPNDAAPGGTCTAPLTCDEMNSFQCLGLAKPPDGSSLPCILPAYTSCGAAGQPCCPLQDGATCGHPGPWFYCYSGIVCSFQGASGRC